MWMGGIVNQVFFLPIQFVFKKFIKDSRINHKMKLYIILNGFIESKFKNIQPMILPIAIRAIRKLTDSQATSDLFKLYVESKNNNIEYNLAIIPNSFKHKNTEFFDRPYMKALFKLGHGLGASGYRWSKAPPGLTLISSRRD